MFLLLFGHFFLDSTQISLEKAELSKWDTDHQNAKRPKNGYQYYVDDEINDASL